jgi:hypothetical protein
MQHADERAQALFGRPYALKVARAIRRHGGGEFTRSELLRALKLGEGQKIASAVTRELDALTRAELISHVAHGRWRRREDLYWEKAESLLVAWENAADTATNLVQLSTERPTG